MRFGIYYSCLKRYKFLLLKDVLSFYQLDNDNQQLLKEEGSNFYRGFVDVRYDRPATLLDEAKYTKDEWDKVTDENIKNGIIKSS